jgi:Tol biopolymer transport system component
VAAAALIALSAVSWQQWRAPNLGAPLALATKLTRVTWSVGLSTEPALSRDGSLVAYASDASGSGNLDLWVQRVAGGTPVRLTTDPADDREPDFSPDGTSIAFRSDRAGGGVFVMPALGGDARLVAPHGRAPRFSPDGSSIAYWVGPWLGGARLPRTAVFIVPAHGGEPTPLAKGFFNARLMVRA